MTLIGKHPYSFLFAGAGIVLLVIVLFAHDQSVPTTMHLPVVRVSGGNTLINPGISSTNPLVEAPQPSLIEQSSTSSATYLPLPINQKAQKNPPVGPSHETNTTIPPVIPRPTESDQLLTYVYSLIPSGIALPTASKPRSPTQQALFEYGNKVGLIVLAFDNAHTDMAGVLKDWFADRTNAGKVAGARSIARDMQVAGRSLADLPNVPSAASAANQALAKGYIDAGSGLLAVIAASGSNSALVDAMKTYDATADSFTNAYISLVDIFSVYGVTFSSSDAGSAFAFPASSF